ncbi:MAG: shikimate kinase [Spirochaetales bacterium]|nr:MAG: shikimate kinase [Spirochaetales bacterium]
MEKRSPRVRRIALIGLPGTGKTSVGRELAKRLDLDFTDLDQVVSSSAGLSIPQLFERFGEAGFRRLETRSLDHVTSEGPVVLSTGGGCVLRWRNRRMLGRRCLVIWLDLSPEAAASRLEAEELSAAGGRPLLTGPSIFDRLVELDRRRRPLYRACADRTLAVTGRSIEEIAEEIHAALD